MRHWDRRSSWLALVAASLAGGCSSRGMVSEKALHDNQELAKANNQLLLLNVVRAKEKHPMFFTAPGGPTDAMVLGLRGALAWPFNREISTGSRTRAATTGEIDPSFERTTSMGTGVLDSEEFWCGITTPLDMDTVAYYWNQGWQRDMLLQVCLERIVEIKPITCANGEPGEERTEYVNHIGSKPDHPDYEKFHKRVMAFAYRGADLSESYGVRYTGPVYTNPEKVTVEGLAKAKEVGLELFPFPDWQAPPGSQWRLGKRSKSWSLTFPRPCGEKRAEGRLELTDGASKGTASEPHDAGAKFEFVLRSPEAILYYLGEIARAEEKGDFRPTVLTAAPGAVPVGPPTEPLFVLLCGVDGGCAGFGVEYCGKQYGIPCGPSAGRSTQVLSLVAQLFAMKKQSKDLPSTNVVQLIGG